MLLDQHRDHLEVGELLRADILQHVADAGVLGVEGLRPIGQRRGKLSGGAAELLEKLLGENRVGITLDVDFGLQDGVGGGT